MFRDIARITGVVMTKLDGTARGGILVSIAEKFDLPVHYVGVGEARTTCNHSTQKTSRKRLSGSRRRRNL